MIGSFHVSAPCRIDIGGGVTDIPEISQTIGTKIVNIGIDLYRDLEAATPLQVNAFCKVNKNLKKSILRINQKEVNMDKSADKRILFQLFQEKYLAHVTDNNTYSIDLINELPECTGLGVSSGLGIVLISVFSMLLQNSSRKRLDRTEVISKAFEFERDDMRVRGGFQDFIGVGYGGLNYIDFSLLTRKILRKKQAQFNIALKPDMTKYLNTHMMVVVGNRSNVDSGQIVSDEIKCFKKNSSLLLPALREIQSSNEQIYNLLIDNGNLLLRLQQIGEAMATSWNLQKSLTLKIKNPLLEKVEMECRELVYGLRGPGAGCNSLFLIALPHATAALVSKLKLYYPELLVFFAKINTRGLQIKLM